MKLYWYFSTNPQKARFGLEELGLAHELVTVDLFLDAQSAPAFVALNPHGKVPVLDDDGFILRESNAILAYLGEREGRLWPKEPKEKAIALQWLFFESTALADPAGTIWFYERVAPKHALAVDGEQLKAAHEAIGRPMAVLEGHLHDRDFILGDFSLVDCAFGPLLQGIVGSQWFDWTLYPNVRRYMEAVRDRPAWAKCDFMY